jgi:4-oxalomesaconate tautomerase
VTQTAIRCAAMRGGTSKGLVFLADDLPQDAATRDAVLLAAMGSPDPREIDGMGGSHPLTSKVAVVSPSARDDADVEYLFLQVWPDRAEVSDSQNCGNMLAAVGPFAIEQGLVAPGGATTPVNIWMRNTETLATALIQTPDRSATTGRRASTACPAPTRPSRSSSPTSPGPPAARCCRPAT